MIITTITSIITTTTISASMDLRGESVNTPNVLAKNLSVVGMVIVVVVVFVVIVCYNGSINCLIHIFILRI